MGMISARTPLVSSGNNPAVEVAQMEGMSNVISLAHQMGINSHLDPGLATAIGGSDVTLLDHVQGYQVFANQGQQQQLNTIKSIDDASGQTVYTHDIVAGPS